MAAELPQGIGTQISTGAGTSSSPLKVAPPVADEKSAIEALEQRRKDRKKARKDSAQKRFASTAYGQGDASERAEMLGEGLSVLSSPAADSSGESSVVGLAKAFAKQKEDKEAEEALEIKQKNDELKYQELLARLDALEGLGE
tara:strand:+ start:1258 stop:1686 length:429 start_codon:yes stop_codon:yes gene_type:complete